MRNRMERLHQALSRLNADGAIFHAQEDVFYYSACAQESLAVVGEKSAYLVTSALFSEAAQRQADGFEVREYYGASLESVLKQAIEDAGITSLAYQEEKLTHAQYRSLANSLTGVSLLPMGNLGMRLRAVKDEGEVSLLREACRLTDRLFDELLTLLRPGISEIDAATELQYAAAKKYGVSMSFPTIIASGVNGSLPHAVPSEKIMREGEAVTVDFGAAWMGYHADMTRTFALGELSAPMTEVYGIVLEAQRQGVMALKPGVSGLEADAVVRDYIKVCGYGDRFVHSLGHGVGLEIHELPNLSARASDQILVPGQTVTVEPGIYLPGIGGVRIEDTCLITQDGCEVLFQAPKQLLTIG